MTEVKISLITVTYNAADSIERCIRSVIGQTYKNVEYIVIDGGSSDKTVEIIKKYQANIRHFVSERDKGIYDAMNKGLKLATGDIVGTLNADDYFAGETALESIAGAFADKKFQILYGDLDYVNDAGKILRKWRSGRYKPGSFNLGWMPPHPTFYCQTRLFNTYGFYKLDYGTAADYELMSRFMHKNCIDAYYLPKVLVKMKIGGRSNKNIASRVKGLLNDFKAMRTNGISVPIVTIFLKPLRKIGQYL